MEDEVATYANQNTDTFKQEAQPYLTSGIPTGKFRLHIYFIRYLWSILSTQQEDLN
jgi:hypothetical protein